MTPEMKSFLLDLADLIEKHDVAVEATENKRGYATYCDGIEFAIPNKWDEAGMWVRGGSVCKVSRSPDPEELRRRANS